MQVPNQSLETHSFIDIGFKLHHLTAPVGGLHPLLQPGTLAHMDGKSGVILYFQGTFQPPCSAPCFTRAGHEDGDHPNTLCAVLREAVHRGAGFLSLAPRPLCECQRSIPLISQIDGIV